MIVQNPILNPFVQLKSKIFLSFVAILIVLLFTTQVKSENIPPSNVLHSFQQLFPTAKKSKWLVTGIKSKEFKVNYRLDNVIMISYFDTNGKLIETEKEIVATTVPEKILNSLVTQYEDYRILNAMEITQDNKVVSYELTIKSDGLKTTVVLSKDGFFTAR